jgi:hypothetical protein
MQIAAVLGVVQEQQAHADAGENDKYASQGGATIQGPGGRLGIDLIENNQNLARIERTQRHKLMGPLWLRVAGERIKADLDLCVALSANK